MSPVSHDTKAPSPGQEDKNNTGKAQGPVYSYSEACQDMPSSAHEYQQQKGKGYPKGDQQRRRDQRTSPFTSQALTRFEKQLDNNFEALDDRVMQYRSSIPIPGDRRKSLEEHQRQVADRVKAWSDEWKRLERE